MSNVGAALAVTFACAAQLTACSSSRGITSLPADKPVSSLTADERRLYCEDRFHYLSARVSRDDRKRITCAVAADVARGAAGTAPDRARGACQLVYQACLNVPSPEPQSSCDAFATGSDGCAATVGEVNACAEAQGDSLEKLASTADATCSNPGRTSREKDPAAQSPSACAKVQLLCPKLFDEPLLGGGRP